MIEALIRKIVEMLEPRIKKWLKEAFDVGYKVGEEDATRRMYDLYLKGYDTGAVDAYAKIGAILPEETSKEMFDQLTTESES